MKDDFELPKKWAIKNCPEVGKWFNSRTGSKVYTGNHHQTHSYLHSHNDYNESILDLNTRLTYAELQIRKNFTEITYQQFEEHVLKKSVVKQKENYNYLIPIIEKLNKL